MLNHITIMGRLVRDPELRHTQTGTSVASFTLAVDRDFKDKQTGEKQCDFINCTAWRATADFVSQYFAKGRMAVVDGRLEIRSYIDKEGNKRTAAEVVAQSVYFGDSKQSANAEDTSTAQRIHDAPPQDGFQPMDGDFGSDLPF